MKKWASHFHTEEYLSQIHNGFFLFVCNPISVIYHSTGAAQCLTLGGYIIINQAAVKYRCMFAMYVMRDTVRDQQNMGNKKVKLLPTGNLIKSDGYSWWINSYNMFSELQ